MNNRFVNLDRERTRLKQTQECTHSQYYSTNE